MQKKRIFLEQECTSGLGENILSTKVLMQLSTASRQLQKIQNKTNSENGHLGFSIFKKNKKTTESVIFKGGLTTKVL